MKRLVFKSWLEKVVIGVGVIGLFMTATIECESALPNLIGLMLMGGCGTLEVIYGRD